MWLATEFLFYATVVLRQLYHRFLHTRVQLIVVVYHHNAFFTGAKDAQFYSEQNRNESDAYSFLDYTHTHTTITWGGQTAREYERDFPRFLEAYELSFGVFFYT